MGYKSGTNTTTIRDIAKLANVSTATVSRVINTPEKTSKEAREKILRIIEDNNYVPNQLAKNIFSKTSNTLAIFVYDITNPFFSQMIFALNRLAFEHNLHLIICDTENNLERELEYLRFCQSTRVSCIILTEGASSDILNQASDTTWITLFDRIHDNENYPLITSDNENGIRTAIAYLENLNHKNIAFIAGPQNMRTGKIRYNAFINYMEEKKHKIYDEYIYYGDFDIATGVKALEYYISLPTPPTAIICSNDQIAKGIVYKSNSLGINIPGDLSIIGFDGTASEHFYPKLTTIKQDVDSMAKLIIKEAIEGKKDESSRCHVVPIEFIIGDTCRKI